MDQSTEPPAQNLQQLKLSSTTSESPSREPAKLPMARPGEGGRDCAQRIELLVNHFKVNFTPTFTILQYHISIRPEKTPKPNVAVKVSKFESSM